MGNHKLNKILFSILFLTTLLYAQDKQPHSTIQLIDGEEYVQTPFGLMLKECVKTVPSGTHIKEQEDGSLYFVHQGSNLLQVIPKNEKCIQKNPKTKLGQWLDNGGWYIPNQQSFNYFEGYYRVPNSPATDNGQILYYFIGAVNFDSNEETIIQPVLTYHHGWSFQPWNCCPSGQAINADPLNDISPNDNILGLVEVDKDNKVYIECFDKNSKYSTLSVDKNNRTFNWIDATLEVYSTTQCSDYPTDYMQFSKMKVLVYENDALEEVQPQWYNQYGETECNGRTTIQDPNTITIQHNVSATEQQ